MARILTSKIGGLRRTSGFNLIEVMVAVVILATGMLALAALQGALARNSADTKARSAVMAALSSRMSEIRQAPPASGKTWTMSDAWVSAAAAQAGSSNLQVVETIAAYRWNGTGYVTTTVTNPASTFTRATLQASWTGAGGAKTLTLASDLSGSMYGLGSGYPVPDPNGSAAKAPIVRQDNPSNMAGVIPIVTGNQATAASNPQPIIEGQDSNLRVGTSFDVLNYVPEGSVAKITKRFQTEVIKCRCEYNDPGYSVAGAPQWPAVWDGNTYSVYPGSGSPAGVSANAGEDDDYAGVTKGNGNGKSTGRLQSQQCTECCRDHHDAAGSALESRYDPEATNVGKYNLSNGALSAVSSGNYVAACRVVKVDGLWRTTADMYQRSYGLLETSSVGGVAAKSGIPSASSTSTYQNYVKTYLSSYSYTDTTPPGDPQASFDGTPGMNDPTSIAITTPSTTDYRYLHSRGLYVDYLGTKAQAAIKKCDGKSGTQYTECLLPVLPFTTINLTEIASWTPSDNNVLAVNTNNTLYFDVDEPSGGRTLGINSGTANSQTVSRRSNSGVAVSDDIGGAVDKNGDESTGSDSQQFVVGSGSTGGSGSNYFWTRLVGAGSSPGLSHTYGNCGKQNGDFQCTSSATLPQNLTLTISKYYTSGGAFNTYNFSGVTCTPKNNGDKAWVASTYTLPATYNTLQRMNITSVTLWNGSSLPLSNVVESGLNENETATVTLQGVPAMSANGYTPVTVNFGADGSAVRPTVKSCVYSTSNAGGNTTYSINSVIWNESWATTL